jgi:hypothetical protein
MLKEKQIRQLIVLQILIAAVRQSLLNKFRLKSFLVLLEILYLPTICRHFL